MFKDSTTSFGAFWSIFTAPGAYRSISPTDEAPRLVYITRTSNGTTQKASCDASPSILLAAKQTFLNIQSDLSRSHSQFQPISPAPTKQRLKRLISHFTPSPAKPSCYKDSNIHEQLAHHCTLCRFEIPPTHFYASRPKKILQENTYISTRCCHQSVHSPCYRITLQYFIDSKGRPRCPICRDYPDRLVAYWALGHKFDKDIGAGEEDECACGDDVRTFCEVCQGRKHLLRDLAGIKLAPRVEQVTEKGIRIDVVTEKEVKLCTIVESEEIDEEIGW